MIGQWIRFTIAPIENDIELGWHRVKDAGEILGDVDGRWRLELHCHVVILVNPKTCERGLPGAAAVICTPCSKAKAKEPALTADGEGHLLHVVDVRWDAKTAKEKTS